MNADKTTKWNLFSIGQQRTIQKDLIFFFPTMLLASIFLTFWEENQI